MNEIDRDISDKLFGCDRDMRNPVNLEHDVVFLVGDDTQQILVRATVRIVSVMHTGQ